ncbi:MAG: MBL fold metallo-hydrolase [Desulfobulbus propionicus]|nr:MAG: MBL fold metallo-hydrolase [Desulfobulbus propionicus]
MEVICLIENTTTHPQLAKAHGLSFFIRTRAGSVLFDMGPDNRFADNARRLGVDLAKTEVAVLSHGHYDHGGGIPRFQRLNAAAEIIMTREAIDGRYYACNQEQPSRYIGLDTDAIDISRCRFIDSDTVLSRELTVFTGFTKKGFLPQGNASLLRQRKNGQFIEDDFSHELALLIVEDSTSVLFTGCAHSGIGNMIDTVLTRTGREHIDHVIGGFHLYNPSTRTTEPADCLDILVNELSAHPDTTFYTGHCTGPDAPACISRKMARPITLFASGARFEL